MEVIERLLEQGNFASGLGRACFSSLLEATTKLKEVEDNVEEEEEEEEDEVQEESGDEDEEETDYEVSSLTGSLLTNEKKKKIFWKS